MTKGYKATYNYKCLNQTYKIGQEYKLDEKPIMCKKGFHYCLNAENTLDYYVTDQSFKLLEIEDLNLNDTVQGCNKSCSNHIKVLREITDSNELIQLLGKICTYDENGNQLSCQYLNNYLCEQTYDEKNNELTYKNSYGYWRKRTYDKYGNQLTFENSDGLWNNKTYDKNGRSLTYKNSYGCNIEYSYDSNENQLLHEIGK